MGNEENKKPWLKWAGIGTFAFFFVKGLLWLIVPALVWMHLN
jgi:hypothetical protein